MTIYLSEVLVNMTLKLTNSSLAALGRLFAP